MKRYIIIVLIAVAVGVIFYTVRPDKNSPKSDQESLTEKIFSGLKQPSPYSIRWGTLLACVVDQQGEPIPNAKLTLQARLKRDRDGNLTEQPPAWHDTELYTNEKGEFNVPQEVWENDPDKKQRFTVCIEADGFLKRTVTLGENWSSDNDGKIDMFRIGRIEGVIIDPNGQPLANAPIWLDTYTEYDNPSSSCSGCFSGNTITDKDGAFVFEKAPPGHLSIKFPGQTGGGCDPNAKKVKVSFQEYVTWQVIDLADGEAKTDVFLDLRQSRTCLTGKVVDEYNRPMAGVNAHISRQVIVYLEHGHSTFTTHLKSALTDDNGIYVLDHIPAGDYQLKAEYPYEQGKHYTSGDEINVYLSGSQQLAFNLVLERQDDSLAKPNYEEQLFEMPLPQDMETNEWMVVDKTGRGVAAATIEFADTYQVEDTQTHEKTSYSWIGATITADPAGRFTLPQQLQAAENQKISCRMTIRADGFESRFIQTDLWRVKNDPRIDLLRRGNIKGCILDQNGQPVEAVVSLQSSMTAHINPCVSTCGGSGSSSVAKNGKFEFQGLPEGVHVISYSWQSKEKTKPINGSIVVYMQNGRDINDFTINLQPAVCEVQGRVLDNRGKPVSKATVRLLKEIKMDQPYGMTTWPMITESLETNRKGEYLIENIQPGVYQIQAILGSDQRKESDKKTIGLSGDRVVDLDLRLRP